LREEGIQTNLHSLILQVLTFWLGKCAALKGIIFLINI